MNVAFSTLLTVAVIGIIITMISRRFVLFAIFGAMIMAVAAYWMN